MNSHVNRMSGLLKGTSLVFSVILTVVLTVALLFGSFGASLDVPAQTRISDDAAEWQAYNGGYIFEMTMKLVNASSEDRLVCICIGIIMLAIAGIIAMQIKKSFLYIAIPAAAVGGLIVIIGLMLRLLCDLLTEVAPDVDWIWYKNYLAAFQNRLILFGGITLVIGIVLIIIRQLLNGKHKKTIDNDDNRNDENGIR